MGRGTKGQNVLNLEKRIPHASSLGWKGSQVITHRSGERNLGIMGEGLGGGRQ